MFEDEKLARAMREAGGRRPRQQNGFLGLTV
jgi:hypothetical protein